MAKCRRKTQRCVAHNMKKSLFLRLLRAFPNKATFVWGMTANIVFSVLTVGFSYLIRVVIDAAVMANARSFFRCFTLLRCCCLSTSPFPTSAVV